jgi:hypothetical protein
MASHSVTNLPMDHPELQKLRQFGVTEEQIESFQVLCLPENLLAAASGRDLLDSQDAVDLAKRLKEAGVSCGTSLELAPDAATLQRTGDDLWLGIVWLLQPSVGPALVKTMSRKLKSWQDRKSVLGNGDPRIPRAINVCVGILNRQGAGQVHRIPFETAEK